MRVPDYPTADSASWAAVDEYFAGLLAPEDEHLQSALAANADNSLPAHDVSATQGKMLALYARMIGATRVLEIGTLGAYSTIWMARALPIGGKVVTIEYDRRHAAVCEQARL